MSANAPKPIDHRIDYRMDSGPAAIQQERDVIKDKAAREGVRSKIRAYHEDRRTLCALCRTNYTNGAAYCNECWSNGGD